jgi:hypothetical protein
VGVIIKFHNRLRKGLTATIYNNENWPDTLDEWQEAMQQQVCRLAIMKEALGLKGNNHLSTKQAKWCSNIPTKPTHCKKNDNVVPMEIDSAKIQGQNPKKEAKNARLHKEGQCFKCHKIGHLKKNCPE